jgi:hypothetical protein
LGIIDCIDYKTGFERWWGAADGPIKSTPAFVGESIIFATTRGSIYSISSLNANKLWATQDDSISTSPSIFEDRFFIASESKTLSCRKVQDGSLLWKQTFDGQVYSTPAVNNNCIFFGCTNGNLYCYGVDGILKWSFKASDSIEGSCTLDGNTCYFGSNDGKIYALDQSTGKLVWSYQTQGRIQTTPTIADNCLFVNSSGGYLYCFKEEALKKQELDRIEIYPSNLDCYINEKMAFSAVGFDKNNKRIDNVKFQWTTEPEDIGIIDQQGIFTALKIGKCSITTNSGNVSANISVNCIERIYPSRIEISPDKAILEFGKTKKFIATVYDNKGNPWENPVLTWQCDPKTIGEMDTEGFFTAGNREADGKIIVKAYGLTAVADVNIEEPKIAHIEIENPNINFENVTPGSLIQTKLKIKNTGNIADNADISTTYEWLTVSDNKVYIDAKSELEITISVKSTVLKKNSSLTSKVVVKTSYGAILEATISITVNEGITCYKTVDTLDFKKVPRGSSKTMTLQIAFNGFQSGKLQANVPWISLSPDTFKNMSSLDVKVTVYGSKLPSGVKFVDFIELVGNDICKETKIKVIIETDKHISIKLKLGLAIATINGNSIPLAVAPQIIKGSTMVPLRLISDAFGCSIDWDPSSKKITIKRNGFEIVLFVDKTEAQVNGQINKLSSPPTIISGKTMVPVRFIAEAFGANVDFNAKTGEISILWAPK